MRAVNSRRIAISWKQTEIDGLEAAPLSSMCFGAAWSWRGQMIVLSDASALNLEKVSSAGGIATQASDIVSPVHDISGPARGRVVLSNGAQNFTADLIMDAEHNMPVLIFGNGCPPRDQEFWVSEFTEFDLPDTAKADADANVVAFPTRG